MATGEDGKAASCHSQSERGKNERVLRGRFEKGVVPRTFFVFLFTLKPKQLPDYFLFNPAKLATCPSPPLRPTSSAPSPHDVSQEESNLRNDIMNDAWGRTGGKKCIYFGVDNRQLLLRVA